MHHARSRHSSCQLAGQLYVFCGIGSNGHAMNLVEKLSVAEKWELIPQINLENLPALYLHLSIALNNEEILIFGGAEYKENKV